MNAKKLIIVIGVILLALMLGFLGSKMIGPTQRTDLPEVDDSGDLDVDMESEDDLRGIEGRDITGDEGETVDGVRVLGPNEPTRVEDRDYFEGLENMEGAVPAGTRDGSSSEMDKMLEKVERQSHSSSQGGANAEAGTGTGTKPGTQGSTTPPAAKPAVERPSAELSELLDDIEGN